MAGTRAGALKGWATKYAKQEAARAYAIQQAEKALRTFENRSAGARKGWETKRARGRSDRSRRGAETKVAKQREVRKYPKVEPGDWRDEHTEYYDVEEPIDSTGKKKRR